MSPAYIAAIGLGCLFAITLAALVAHVFYKGASDLTTHRKLWVDLAGWCKEIKLPHAAAIFGDLAVGDLIGAVQEGEKLAATLRDPTLRGAVMAEHDLYAFSKMLDDPTKFEQVKAAVQAKVDAKKADAGRQLQALKAAAAPASSGLAADAQPATAAQA